MPAPLAAGTARAGQRVLPNGRVQRLTDVMAPVPSTERHVDWVTDRRRQARGALYGERLWDWATSATVVADADACLADANGDVSDRFMRLDQRRFLPDNVLVKADRAGMLHSLEVRTPYLERNLAEFAATMPTHHHLRQGGKALLRRLLPRLLPAYKGRPKLAFRIPLDDWLRGPLAPLVDAQAEGPLVRDGWIDGRGYADAVAEHRAGQAEHAGLVWHLLTLGLWLEGQGDDAAA
jgi:asparagine synthase (glutamine-hydrolysing)